MADNVVHPFVSAKADPADTTLVRPSNWNAKHTIGVLVTNNSGGTLNANDVAVYSLANDDAVVNSTVQAAVRVPVVIQDATIANAASGQGKVTGAMIVANQGAVTRGNYIRLSATTNRVEDTGIAAGTTPIPVGSVGQALTGNAGSGTITAWMWGFAQQGYLARGELSGCQLTWVSGTSLTVGAGKCRDDADTDDLSLLAATTQSANGAWVVGNNQPKDSSDLTLANGMTVHWHVIKRTDTGVVDILRSANASGPTLPTGYTKSRRVFSLKFSTGAQTTPQVIQDGDFFQLNAGIVDVNATNPGTAAVARTLSVPTGINVEAQFNFSHFSSTVATQSLFSDLAVSDELPNVAGGTSPGADGNSLTTFVFTSWKRVRTNTSGQIRSRVAVSDANLNLTIILHGWYDTRGRAN